MARQLTDYYLGAFLEYDSSLSSQGDSLSGFLTRRKGEQTNVVAFYAAPAGRWEVAAVPLPAAGVLLPAGALALASLRRRRG